MALRIIQWGTGAVGREVLATTLDPRSGLELAGVKVYSDAKDGVDAGELIGREPVGVTASTDSAAVLAVDADCVVYTPRLTDVDEVCSILAGGKNVVTTAFLFHPARIAPADRDRVLAACHEGGTTVHGCGLNPGNLSGALPLAMTGMSRTIEKLTLQERADWSVYDSTAITFDNMRFGAPVDEISVTANDFLAFNSSIFVEQVWLLADALRAGIDEVTADVEAVPAEHDHEIFDHVLQAGTTAGQRWNWVGRRNGEPLVEIETLWTVGNEYPKHWPKPRHGWTLTIEGDPSMQTHFTSLASFRRDVTMLEHVNSANVATGMQVLNAVPAVCAAPPGFATIADLPQVRSLIGFGNAPK
ncbi:dihydrodipicolinate reductase [Mycolicibacterium arabiense]|uniref:Dihydrodipicolinate reductase n=1 Tax=Mycolicibacterium arabiense TaxID=1286181 RepID=A0A7I7S1R6_9MYCO|nr:dihydrodipicolinate reductase [Mycolicibacterium arabiense]MCV7374981.1 dihydrodipicolinate reductase [Mycolicibacterium arabiense]BBY50858.1 dihydrodipicolinate reductase [Mycolicibacterium arabiense]